jgi:hypothetical protein
MKSSLCKYQDRAGPPVGEIIDSFYISSDGQALEQVFSQLTSPSPGQKPGVGEVAGFRKKTPRASKC